MKKRVSAAVLIVLFLVTASVAAFDPLPVFDEELLFEPYFYPAGWSKSGNFGFLELHDEPGRGGFVVRFVIQSMVTDEVLVRYREWGGDYDDVSFLNYQDDHAQIAEYFFTLWRNELLEYGLPSNGPLSPVELHSFPYTSQDGVAYSPKLDVVSGGDTPFIDDIEAFDLWLKGDNGTQKRVTSGDPKAVELSVKGYFQSPYEKRIAVVLIERRYAFEGYEPWVSLAGSNMAVGFE